MDKPRRARLIHAGITLLVAAVVLLGLPYLAWWHSTNKYLRIWEQEKRPKLAAAAEAAQPLLDALEAYKRDHGRYPEELAALAPEYLDEIPEPQDPLRDPEWWYGVLDDDAQFFLFAHPPDNYYGVPIQPPTNAEMFIYESDGSYDHHPWTLRDGGLRAEEPLTMIGDWAYYASSTTPPRGG